MRWLSIIAGIGAIFLSFIWFFKGFKELPQFWVYSMLILSILDTIKDRVLASFGYKLETKVVKIKE